VRTTVNHLSLWCISQLPDRAAETRVHALEQSLRDLGDGNPDAAKHMDNEAKIRQELAEVTKKLERYQSLYGSTSALSPDVQHLSNQLQEKEEEIQKLRASETQRIQAGRFACSSPKLITFGPYGQAESSLYSELDKLSTAWEALDRQVKSKVFDLINVEERLVKSSHDVSTLTQYIWSGCNITFFIESQVRQ
jgi:E3 ubiquitin-protein ligase BRE1